MSCKDCVHISCVDRECTCAWHGGKLGSLDRDVGCLAFETHRYFHYIRKWAEDRNLIEGSDSKSQFVKLIEEVGELASNINKGKDISDDIGDCMVVLTIIAAQNGLTPEECLAVSWKDIKDRKGKMVDGVFIKEGD